MAVVHVTGLHRACEVLREHTGWTHDRCARECNVSLSTWQKMIGANSVVEPMRMQLYFVERLSKVYANQLGKRPTLTVD